MSVNDIKKSLRKMTAAMLFALMAGGTVLAGLPVAYAEGLPQNSPAGAESVAPSEEQSAAPSSTPEDTTEPAASASASPEGSPSQEPAPSVSPEEQEPSPSPSESSDVIFEHVPNIIIPVPRAILYSNISGFPASYQAKLQALQSKYPNWVFTPVILNLDWNTVITEESKTNRCTIQKSVDVSLTDPAAGTYDSGWMKASRQADAYFIDPRNFLTPTRIFQFEQLTFDSRAHTEAGVEAVMKNSFMSNKMISYLKADGTQVQTDKLYSRAVLEAGAAANLSPYYIVSKIKQEIGTSGTSRSISGKEPGYEGLYNYFNIGANDGPNNIENGLNYAKGGSTGLTSYNRPWTDPMKAITGGAINVAERFVAKSQDTVYFQRFNVRNNPYYSHFTHQYMTNVAGAASEAYNTYTAYNGAGQMNDTKVFLIPVYQNMPEYNTNITINSATHTGSTTADGVNVRTGPNTSYDSVGVKLNKSDKVEIIGGYRNDLEYTSAFLNYPYWAKVRFTKSGKTYEGYVSTTLFTPDSERNMLTGESFNLNYSIGNSERAYFGSSNPSVATVSETGVVKAVGTGKAIIYAYNSSGNRMDMTAVDVIGAALPAPSIRFLQTRVRDGQYQHVLNWEAVAGASGYEVHWASSENGNYQLAAQFTDGGSENYVGNETEGVVKYYKVRAYRMVNGNKQYGSFSEVKRNLPAVKYRFVMDRVRDGDYQYVLNWEALPEAEGYEVYSSSSETGSFALAADMAGGTSENFVDAGQKQGVPKYYKVRPYQVVLGAKSYGAFTDVQMAGQATDTPSLLYVQVADTASQHVVTWQAVADAEGYEVYAASSENGAYSLVGTAAGNKANYTCQVAAGTVRYYKIRAYRTIDGAKRYSRYSQSKKNLQTLSYRFVMDRMRDGDYQYVLNWVALPDAEGYEIYSSTSENGNFALAMDFKGSGNENFVDAGQTKGVPKYYKVRPYQTVSGVRVYGGFTDVQKAGYEQALTAPKVRFLQTRVRDGQYQHVLNWEAVAGASGYEVHWASSENGAYQLAAEISGGNNENYVSAETEGVVKYYKVRAYRMVNGNKQYGSFSQIKRILPTVEYRFVMDRTRDGDYQYVLNWVALPDAEGYEIYSSTSENGNFVLATDLKGGSNENFVHARQTKGVPRYYKVRPYQMVLGAKSYGAFTDVRKVGEATQAPLTAPKVRFLQTRVRDGQYQHVLNWEAVAGASGYEVHWASSENGAYQLAAEISGGNNENYVSAETEGVVKYYKVRAYRMVNGNKQYGSFSQIKRILPTVEYRFVMDRTRDGDYQYVLNWVALPDAEGYEIYSSTSENGNFVLATDLKGGSNENFVHARQTKGVPRYYKVRPYQMVLGAKSYGAFTDVQKVG